MSNIEIMKAVTMATSVIFPHAYLHFYLRPPADLGDLEIVWSYRHHHHAYLFREYDRESVPMLVQFADELVRRAVLEIKALEDRENRRKGIAADVFTSWP